MKKMFGIESNHYKFEWQDISTALTVINVALIFCGFPWAPLVGILNASMNLILSVKRPTHVNLYVMNFALLAMNLYFLKG